MQTPHGYPLSPDGRFLPTDWWQIVFNPSFPYRLIHMMIASYPSVAFIAGVVAAFHLRGDLQSQAARLMFSMAMWMAVVVAPIQLLAGDQHELNTPGVSTGKDHGDGGRLGHAPRDAADTVCDVPARPMR
jgi:cytochrome d ubiquinol oxidase subunit I